MISVIPRPNSFSVKNGYFDLNAKVAVKGLDNGSKIHLGGDEVPKSNWFSCEKCVDIIKKKHLINGQGLQTYFFNRIIKYLNDCGKQVILWNESIVDKNIDVSAVCQFWNTIEPFQD